MDTLHRIAFVFAGLVTCAAGPVEAGRTAAGGCAHGRFVVTEGRQLLGGQTVLVLDGASVSVEGACPATGVAVARRKGTRVSARRERCGDLPKARLQATARDCSGLRGTVRAGRKRATLVAVPSTCGDGEVDAGAGEHCDATQPCANGGACSTSCHCPGVPQRLECERSGYPCAWSDVAPDVLARTEGVMERAGAVLDGGGSTAEAARVVEADAPAELQYDARVLRFRLPGGRPAWVGRLDGAGDSSASAATAAASVTAAPRPHSARSVLAPGTETKRAYVLSPFAWQPLLAGRTAGVVGILSGTRGYEGRVTHLASASAGSGAVGVAEFARFAGHNVVYVASHGATICEDLETGQPTPCRTIIAAQSVTSVAAALAGSSVKGVDSLRYEDGTYWLVLGADFFRHHYPGGLQEALVVFDGCESAGSDLEDALAGWNTNVVGWNGGVPAQGSVHVLETLFAGLAQGRAVHEVYESMGTGVTVGGVFSSATLVVGAQNVRIRELPRLVDPVTGQPLESTGRVRIEGRTGDGKPDALHVGVEVEGIAGAEAAGTIVHVQVDGVEIGAEPLATFAVPQGEYRWRGEVLLEIDRDFAEGERIDLKVFLDLPEGGMSMDAATPTVTGEGWQLGRVWRGTFTKVTNLTIATILIEVEATFERDPDESGTTNYPTFLLAGGTMKWSLTDGGGDDCVYSAPTTTVPLGPDEQSQLTFNLTKDPVEYRGSASSAGPSVPLSAWCGDGGSPPDTSIEAGGTWFTAPSDVHYTVGESTISGVYAGNAVSHNTWTITRVE